MISSASHDSVSRLVAERSMCFATASDKAFEKIDCMIAILCCQAKNRLYESSQRLIQPRRVRCFCAVFHLKFEFPKLQSPRATIKPSQYQKMKEVLEEIDDLVERVEG